MDGYALDPVERYRSEYKQKFSELTAAFLEKAVTGASINTAANKKLASEIDVLIEHRSSLNTALSLWIALSVIGWGVFIAAAIYYWCGDSKIPPLWIGIFWGLLAVWLVFFILKCIPRMCRLTDEIKHFTERIDQKKQEAYDQLRPFYDQFSWNTVTKLIEQVFPRVRFDDFLPRERMDDLFQQFGLSPDELAGSSTLFAHSGTLCGYPFLFLHRKYFEWGSKTYYGHKTISWRETYRDSNGKTRTVTRTETLTASVTKPFPEFPTEKLLIFGHEAAPELSFSRTPSSLSGDEDSFWTHIGKKMKMRELNRLAQDLTDDSDFTMMSNRDFELLFNSTDRDDEVAYRLLFTPLAQQNMVKLLNDQEVGFGDDFVYLKEKMITTIAAGHLSNLEFSTEPVVLEEYDLDRVKHLIQTRYERFFASIFFALAPLLTIPLYNTRRLEHDTPRATGEVSSLEMETIANYQGDGYYKHPACITECLLKVCHMEYDQAISSAVVTAIGFRGEPQVEYVSVFGGDGKFHHVPVDWTDYIQVARNSILQAAPCTEGVAVSQAPCIRRNLAATLPRALRD